MNAIIILGKNKQQITEHVYKNNTMTKTERKLTIGRSGCGKNFLILSLLKERNRDDVYIFCKTDNRYP